MLAGSTYLAIRVMVRDRAAAPGRRGARFRDGAGVLMLAFLAARGHRIRASRGGARWRARALVGVLSCPPAATAW